MTAKRFTGEFDNQYSGVYDDGKQLSNFEVVRLLNELAEENEQLKQYKQSVSDVLSSWSQKNLTAKQLQVIIAIIEELNVVRDKE